MKYSILLFILFFQCAVWYPCNIVEIKEEMCIELIKSDTTYNREYRIERHIRELYKWKARKCNCYNGIPERY